MEKVTKPGFRRTLFTMSKSKKPPDKNVYDLLVYSKSDPPWFKGDFLDECFYKLKNKNGPLLYKTLEIIENDSNPNPDSNLNLFIPTETLCFIMIKKNKKRKNESKEKTNSWIRNGNGCYFGNGFVLTARHLFKDPDCKILVVFKMGEEVQIYKAEFPLLRNTDVNNDQTFIKLCGNTASLGVGLQNQLGKTIPEDIVYFISVDRAGNIVTPVGPIIPPKPNVIQQYRPNEFIIYLRVASKPGDSGSPVFSAKTDKLLGVYLGIFTSEKRKDIIYGSYTEISPDFLPDYRTELRRFTDLMKSVVFKLRAIAPLAAE